MKKPASPFILYLSHPHLRAVQVSFTFLLLVLFACLLPFPLPPYLDFQVLYHADLGLLQGIPLYDRAGQAEMIARFAGVTPDRVFVLPFPYPPWYALSTVYLALPPAEVAARLWFGMNVLMLAGSVWLITNREKPKSKSKDSGRWLRSFAKMVVYYFLAILFVPALGSLYVGQYVFPVLLGAALLTFSLRRENAALAALASALLTFKPHLGGPLAVAALIYLFLRRDDFSRRALKAIFVTAIFLFALGFLADPAWPVNYLRSLLGFRDIPGVSSCGLCASLPVALVGLATGQTSIAPALWLGVALFIASAAALGYFRRDLFRAPESVVSIAALVTLLADPYLLNYDFTLLLAPLFLLSARIAARRVDWPWLGIAYLLPAFLLGVFGRGGNLFLPLTAMLLLSYQILRAKPIDVSPREA